MSSYASWNSGQCSQLLFGLRNCIIANLFNI
jgi:hypothetical protein